MRMDEQHILLVEENDADAELMTMAFRRAKIVNPLFRLRDGIEALDYLFGRGDYVDRPLSDSPAVVLLDQKLPRLSGQDVLKALRADERTRGLPIVILTSSNEGSDRQAADEHFANSYVLKPVDFDQFVAAVLPLSLYWLVSNVPPPISARALTL
jgi:two-component system, response regulator